eukprot:TRINITY_DN76424_c0_g1_i1.p2 TRINITY_DN76424_c0_g1~~TRINITY_DN76424_c0_g1_i1.p2  ORF type:complete len:103 (-),score=6.88 TRINITY_DN76424_c0_g1_i1:606-869(-)
MWTSQEALSPHSRKHALRRHEVCHQFENRALAMRESIQGGQNAFCELYPSWSKGARSELRLVLERFYKNRNWFFDKAATEKNEPAAQ